MKIWECAVCGIVYDEAKGWPDEGIVPGTKWEDVPSDWLCPDCGVGKDEFEMVEIQFLSNQAMRKQKSPSISTWAFSI